MTKHASSRRSGSRQEHSAHAMTLEEIAEELGVTRERVRQIEVRALQKARVILERRGYTLWDLLDAKPTEAPAEMDLFGETRQLAEWEKELGIPASQLRNWRAHGVTLEQGLDNLTR